MSSDTPPPKDPSEKALRQEGIRALIQASRRFAGPGAKYYALAKKYSTPLVFRAYGGEDIVGTIKADGGIRFTLVTEAGRRVVDKLDLQYACQAASQAQVAEAVEVHPGIVRLQLKPIGPRFERYEVPNDALKQCQGKDSPWLRLVLRGGEVLEGRVEWWGGFDIKLELAGGKSVVVFRHAVYAHEVVEPAG